MLVVTKYGYMLSSAHSITGELVKYAEGAAFSKPVRIRAGQITGEILKQEPQRVITLCPSSINDMRSMAVALFNYQTAVFEVSCYGASGAEVEEMSDTLMARFRAVNKFSRSNETPFYSIIGTGGMGYRYSIELDWHIFSTSYRIIYAGKRAIN